MRSAFVTTLILMVAIPIVTRATITSDEPRTVGKPLAGMEGVKTYPFNTLVKVTHKIGDKKIFFRVVSPKGLTYDSKIENGTFYFYSAMPREGIVFWYGVDDGGQMFTPDEYTLAPEGPAPTPTPATELERQVESLNPTSDEASAVVAAFNRALTSSQDTDTLMEKAFTNIKPIVQQNIPKWTPFLTWLKTDFETNLAGKSFDAHKKRIKEIADAFAS